MVGAASNNPSRSSSLSRAGRGCEVDREEQPRDTPAGETATDGVSRPRNRSHGRTSNATLALSPPKAQVSAGARPSVVDVARELLNPELTPNENIERLLSSINGEEIPGLARPALGESSVAFYNRATSASSGNLFKEIADVQMHNLGFSALHQSIGTGGSLFVSQLLGLAFHEGLKHADETTKMTLTAFFAAGVGLWTLIPATRQEVQRTGGAKTRTAHPVNLVALGLAIQQSLQMNTFGPVAETLLNDISYAFLRDFVVNPSVPTKTNAIAPPEPGWGEQAFMSGTYSVLVGFATRLTNLAHSHSVTSLLAADEDLRQKIGSAAARAFCLILPEIWFQLGLPATRAFNNGLEERAPDATGTAQKEDKRTLTEKVKDAARAKVEFELKNATFKERLASFNRFGGARITTIGTADMMTGSFATLNKLAGLGFDPGGAVAATLRAAWYAVQVPTTFFLKWAEKPREAQNALSTAEAGTAVRGAASDAGNESQGAVNLPEMPRISIDFDPDKTFADLLVGSGPPPASHEGKMRDGIEGQLAASIEDLRVLVEQARDAERGAETADAGNGVQEPRPSLSEMSPEERRAAKGKDRADDGGG